MATATAVFVTVTITPIVCGECGVVFGLSEDFIKERRRSGQTFWCPNGHGRAYRETEADRLRKELERTERQLGYARGRADSVQDQYDAERRQHAATKGQLTKTRKRVAAGVCPSCTRHFPNLAGHMSTKHPDYAEPKA